MEIPAPENEICTVYLKGYSALSSLHGRLFQVRRGFFKTGAKARGKAAELRDGESVLCRYAIGRGKFRWKVKKGRAVLEQAFPQTGGYCIVARAEDGRMLSRTEYGEGHRWERTSFYGPDAGLAEAVLSRMSGGGLSLLRYDPAKKNSSRETLYPCPVEMGTARQSVIDSGAGEPPVYAACVSGDFCFCGESELAKRRALLEKLESGEVPDEPVWRSPEKAEPAPDLSPDSPAEKAPPAPRDGSYFVDRELFHQDAPAPKAVPASSVRYAVAAKRLDGTVLAPGLDSAPAGESPEQSPAPGKSPENPGPAPPESEPGDELPVKNIVVSAEESYLYFGQVLDGMRHGRGRTQMPDGKTAYEGGYFMDKREGFGTYYYKTGKLCYAGDWKGNRRDGAGAAFSPEGELYAGGFRGDRPHGMGALFGKDGSLCYAGPLKDGARDGAGASYRKQDGTLFVGAWSGGRPTGQGSAFDPQGRLRYNGGWKDGMRDGMGTEYNEAGAVIFVGLWEKDRRVRGVEYENGAPKPYRL